MTDLITNYNQLETKSIQLIIERTPHINYFCTSASIPGITATAARQPSPFVDVKVTGDKLVFQPLIVNCIIDEDMNNWQEIFDWMVSYAHPTTFEEYADRAIPQRDLYSSKKSGATLLIPNNKYNTQHEFQFIDAFPIDVSDIVFDVQISQTPVAIFTITFEYSFYYKRK